MACVSASSCSRRCGAQRGSAVHVRTAREINGQASARSATVAHAASVNSRATEGLVAAVAAVTLLTASPAQADLNKFEAAVRTSLEQLSA